MGISKMFTSAAALIILSKGKGALPVLLLVFVSIYFKTVHTQA